MVIILVRKQNIKTGKEVNHKTVKQLKHHALDTLNLPGFLKDNMLNYQALLLKISFYDKYVSLETYMYMNYYSVHYSCTLLLGDFEGLTDVTKHFSFST